MSLLTTTILNRHLIILVELPVGTSYTGRRLLQQQVLHIFRGLYTSRKLKLFVRCNESYLALMSNQLVEPQINVSLIVKKMEIGLKGEIDRLILPSQEIESVIAGLELWRMPAQEILRKSSQIYLSETTEQYPAFVMKGWLGRTHSLDRAVCGWLEEVDVESREAAETSTQTSTQSLSTNGGVDIPLSQVSLLTTSTEATDNGSDHSLRSGRITTRLSLRKRDAPLRLDPNGSLSPVNTGLRTSSPTTQSWLKRCREDFVSSALYPESPLDGKKKMLI